MPSSQYAGYAASSASMKRSRHRTDRFELSITFPSVTETHAIERNFSNRRELYTSPVAPPRLAMSLQPPHSPSATAENAGAIQRGPFGPDPRISSLTPSHPAFTLVD